MFHMMTLKNRQEGFSALTSPKTVLAEEIIRALEELVGPCANLAA
jgi:hypothetical protein